MSSDHTLLVFSDNETAVLGLKTGRCNAEDFDPGILARQVLEERYDICRLKIPAEDELASIKLQQTGLPFYFSGSIRRYKTPITAYPPGAFYHPEMVYEMYDGSQDALLKEMLLGTWGTYPVGYYRTPWLCHLVTKEAEIESVYRFYKKYNLNRDYPQNAIMFMKDGENYVGFFALNTVNGNLESHIGGILAPYRKGGYFLDMLRYIKIYCVEHQLSHFLFGARNENAEVQKIFQEVGFKALGSENVFHIPALLSHSDPAPENIAIDIDSRDTIPALLHEALHTRLPKKHFAGINSRTRVLQDEVPKGRYNFKITFPVSVQGECLLTGVLEDPAGKITAFAYCNTTG